MRIVALFFAIMIVSLSPDRLAGHYVLEGEHEVGSELVLRRGGQFEYMRSDYVARGKWHVAGEKVMLDSKLPTTPAFRLVRSLPLRTPDVRVWVATKNGAPASRLNVVLTTESGDVSATTDRDGMAIFPASGTPKSVVIHVPVYNKDSGVVSLNPADTDFTFEINPEALMTVPFHGEALKIVGDTLELLYWDKTKPMVYRRQK